jgi:hypothetical protein
MNARSPGLCAAFVVCLVATAAAWGAPASNTSQPVWTRVNVLTTSSAEYTPVLVVPATATSPYFLRQTYTNAPANSSLMPYTQCDLHVNGMPAQILPLMAGATTDLNVPFKAGEAITVRCAGSINWTFVFSN